MASPDIGTGAQFLYGSALISSATAIGTVTSITPSIGSRGVADASHLGSTGARDLLPQLTYTPGEVTIEAWLDGDFAAYDAYLKETAVGGVVGAFHVVIPVEPGAATTKQFTWQGHATSFELGAPFEDMVTGTWTFQMEGVLAIA